MEKYESIEQQRSMKHFTWWVILSQILGIVAVVLVAVWMGHFRGGFAWTSDPGKEFNYHPLFMVIGMVFLFGDALLVYRVFRNDRKIYIKILHAALQVFAMIFAIVGLKAVFDSHNLAKPPIPNMYSLHSWIGLATVILFGLQWVSGFVTFLAPGLSQPARGTYKPVHVFWGMGIFVLAIATALMGITEKAFFSVKGYNQSPREGIVLNCLGLALVCLGLTVGYILTNPNFARQPLEEEQSIILSE